MAERRRASGGARTASRKPGINRDYSDTDYRESNVYDGPEPTRGIYRLELVAVGDHQTNEGNESTKWTFRIMDGQKNKHNEEVAGWSNSKYTNGDKAKFVEQNIAVALGLIKPGGKLAMSYDDILRKAKPCRALIVPERYIPEEGEPEWRSTITSSFLPDKPPEDTDDDDDEEEEAPPPRATRSRGRKQDPEPEEDEEDDEAEDEAEGADVTEEELNEYADELEGLPLALLKAKARDHGVTVKRGMKADAIIDAILEDVEANGFPEDEDEEDEPEPEPAKRPARGSRRTAKRGYSDEPPF